MIFIYANAIKKLSAFIFLTACMASHKKGSEWDNASIDPDISKESIYAQLDQQREVLSPMENDDPQIKRSSDVSYFSGKKTSSGQDEYDPKNNNCRANFYNSDTLVIRIGMGSMESGQGFTICYKDGKFYTEPYSYDRNIAEESIKSTYKIIYQKLTLNKSMYAKGDSVYGNIEFKSTETNNNKEEQYGKGSFRAKIRK